MTPGQKARVQGFNASLKTRGVSLRLEPNGPTYPALLGGIEADLDPRTLSNAERGMVVVAIKSESLGSQKVQVGDTFTDASGFTYRVVKVQFNPPDIAQRFTCEAAPRP